VFGAGTSREIVFARVRVIIDAPAAGTYVVRHPYGELRFDNVPAGKRAVTYTEDIGLAVGAFDLALGGKLGPFLAWDSDQANLVYPHAGAPTETFVGDPNVPHTVTGSPIGFNEFEVSYLGPTPVDLGEGGPIASTLLFSVLGQKFTDPIPVPLKITRSRYAATDATSNNVQIDVWAETGAATGLYVSGDVIRTVEMAQAPAVAGSPLHTYQASFTTTGGPPGPLTVSSVADPLSFFTGTLTDEISGARATYDAASGSLAVSACSSDRRAAGSTLFASGAPLAPDASAGPGCFSGTLAGVVFPPAIVDVTSSKGGRAGAPVVVARAPSLPLTSTAIGDGPYSVPENSGATGLPVGANDLDPGPGLGTSGTVVVLTGPAHGTAAGGSGQILYTPAPFYSGADVLTYAFLDRSGHLSSAATVNIDVLGVNLAPVARNDAGTVANVAGAATTVAVLANDEDPEGQPLSVLGLGTAPTHGTATVNADGTITYRLSTRFAAAPATDAFSYHVTDGVSVSTATVTISVTPGPETLAATRADYVQNKRRWRVEGTSTFVGPGNSVTIYSGKPGVAGTQVLATGVPVDATGLFTWDSGANARIAPATNPGVVTVVSAGGTAAQRAITFK
jgi:hypothetical protein